VLVGFVALGIDVGYMYSVRNDLQRSVDSGALAGAFAFHDGGWVGGPIPPALQGRVQTRALFFATRDPVGAAPLPIGAITFAYPGVNQIQVTAQTNVNLFFAGVIGSPTVALSATAIAEAIPVDQNVECLTPLAFPYPYTDTNGDGDWDPGETIVPPGSIPQGLPVTFPNNQVANTEPVSPPPPPILPPNIGNYVRYGLGGIGGAGEIFPFRMCGDSEGGSSDLRNRINNPCGDGCNAISINDTLSLKGDPTFDPAIDEINGSIIPGDPTGFWPGGYPLPDSLDPNYYQANDLWMYSPRVMRVVLYDPQTAKTSGVIRADRFAGFWVLNADNSGSNRNITGYLIPDSAVGVTSSSPALIEPSLKTTRLIQ
ncbi:MAG: pilus assembly protein TadG-related protein, partial [Candidatus Deferrimicrobiaceae bacterium]